MPANFLISSGVRRLFLSSPSSLPQPQPQPQPQPLTLRLFNSRGLGAAGGRCQKEDVASSERPASRSPWKRRGTGQTATATTTWHTSPAWRRRNRRLLLRPPDPDEAGGQRRLERVFSHLLRRTLRMEALESAVTVQREAALRHSLSQEELELRGLALFGLQIDPTFWRFQEHGKIDVRLWCTDRLNNLVVAKGFRTGKLVDIVLAKKDGEGGGSDSQPGHVPKNEREPWRTVPGIISSMTDTSVYVRIDSVANYFSEALGHGVSRSSRKNAVYLLKRSEENIYHMKRRSLERCQREYDKTRGGARLGPVARAALPGMFHGLGENKAEGGDDDEERRTATTTIFNPYMDESQREAVRSCDRSSPITVIHGPPGTGKTTTLAAAVLSFLAGDPSRRVLVAAPSHAACDAAMLAIIKYWPVELLGEPHRGVLIRSGRELRLTVPSLKPFLSGSAGGRGREDARRIESDLRLVRQELLSGSQSSSFSSSSSSSSSSSWSRGQLLKLEHDLTRRLASAQNEADNSAMEAARVVVCTNLSALHVNTIRQVESGRFDLVCLDEAGFATDGIMLTLMAKAKKIILSGDHLQLPPVVQDEDAKKDGYDISLLERLSEGASGAKIPEVNLLTTQYRSNRAIAAWSSAYFYRGLVESHPSVAKGRLLDLPTVAKERWETNSPLLFVDTRGHGYSEETDPFNDGSSEDSVANYNEAFVVEELVKRYLSFGVQPTAVGVITPYWAQVSLLRSLLWTDPTMRRIEVRTVDGYQGREKELIFLSLVRSNVDGEVGFLEDTRRINVSVTRAKKACVIVGDTDTLGSDAGIRSLINYCQANGAVVNVSSVIN